MSAVDDIAAYLAYLKTGGNSIDQIIFDELPNGEEMNATDELRRLLDERGVEWRKAPHYSGESQDNETIFEGNGIEWYTNDHMNGRLGLRALRYEVTPQQAVEATLGSDLKAENEKLRELVLHMHTCLEHYEPGDTISCKQCPYDNETWGCDYERLMAELGIEVD